jgi:hypothetical protein
MLSPQALNRTLVLPGFWYARTGVLDGKVRQRSRLGQHSHKANKKDMQLEPVGLFFDLATMKSRCGVQVATHLPRPLSLQVQRTHSPIEVHFVHWNPHTLSPSPWFPRWLMQAVDVSTFRRECGDKWATVRLGKGVKDFVYSGANGDIGYLPVVTRTLLELANMGGPPPKTVRPLSSPRWEDALAVLSQDTVAATQVRAGSILYRVPYLLLTPAASILVA